MMLALFTIRYTPLHYLIYATTGAYFLAFLIAGLSVLTKIGNADNKLWNDLPDPNKPKPADPLWIVAHIVFAVGFVLATTTYIYRWIDVGVMPLQNLFEVFLSLMMMIWPISIICKRFLSAKGQTADMLIAACLCAMPIIRDPSISPPRPAMQTHLFIPHVAAYMLGTIIMVKATIQAIIVLIRADQSPREDLIRWEKTTYRLVSISFPPITMGLILGCIWAKYAWGDFWGWDPKEQWSLATWLTFVGYFHMRYMFGRKYLRLNAVGALVCMALLLITLLWANLSAAFSGIHSYA